MRISDWSSDVCSSDLYAQPWEAAAGVPEVVAVARACDSAGFAYIAVCDHVAIPAPLTAAMGATWWDTVATLSYLAAATERVRLLSHVYVLPYRHPLVAAKAWATLDVLSGGRAVLGVGARTSGVSGKRVSVRVDLGGRRRVKKK